MRIFDIVNFRYSQEKSPSRRLYYIESWLYYAVFKHFQSFVIWQAKTFNVTFSEYVDSSETNRNETDDFEVVDAIDWEFDTPIPSWLQKAINQHKLLTSQTDPSERFKLAKE